MSMISKQLTKNDIEKSLLIPTDSFRSFPVQFEGGCFFNVAAVDGAGKAWDFPCFVQQSEGIVSVGWLQFLSGIDVRVGDTVFLHRKSMDGDDGDDSTANTFPVPFEGDRFFNVTAVDGTGKAWDFPCFVQQSEGIVSVGWLRFLSGKDVRAGDTVFLLRKPMDGGGGDLTASAKLKIEVKRKIRLMGEDIWAVLQ
ncbi:AP2/ERF and B3 domain-containing transcription repressor RAV2-like [Gossypium australe]|uniref:AP2/ERF and B3 domain-containing transcription repressor RAV2-like n=1 Tax=Gossypium australe TaxID=47621 RepID=A0A5B6WKN8_9ROSI|nr:AP2/ERF and B3 domain-containing transcription repressor RAV2-like [Gossypium australe]